MLSLLKLLLPALLPSWRFFDSVGPSPRIEYTLDEEATDWREFRPRPAASTGFAMLRRLFWNPVRNENLFLTSCAERLLENPTEHSRREIERRIEASLADGLPYLRFRVAVVSRHGARIVRQVAYAAPARRRAIVA